MTLYRGLRIWDGENGDYLPADTLAVADGRISGIGSHADFEPSEAADSVDCSGLTALPGLIDCHVHMELDPALRTPAEQIARDDATINAHMDATATLMARAGITTARDLGGGRWLELTLRDRIARGELDGPRLLCAGQPITSTGGHCHFWGGEAADLDAAREVIDRQKAHGVDLIKIMATGGNFTKNTTPSRAQFDADLTAAIVAAARAHGFAVAAHCHGTEGIDFAARAGVTTIEHCSWLGDDGKRSGYDPDVAAAIAARGVWVSPTINAGWARFKGGTTEPKVRETFAAMRAAGIRLVASTDAGIPNVWHADLGKALPVFAHYAGLAPHEALQSATCDAATALGLGDETGRLATGLAADVLFVEGDVLSDLGALLEVRAVLANGRLAREFD